MIYTEKYYTQNNIETLEFSRDRGYFFYRLQVLHQKAAFQAGAYLPMRMKLFLSLFENKACVIDAVSGFSAENASLTVLCSSYVPPESFALSLRKLVPSVIIEQLAPDNARQFLEQQMGNGTQFPSGIRHTRAALLSAKELLLALLLEYRGLICETGIPHKNEADILAQSGIASGKHFFATFLFYEKDRTVYAVPSFMVSRLETADEGYRLAINELWHGGKEFASGVHCCKNIDIMALQFCEKKERGYYRARVHNQEFTVYIPSLRNFRQSSEDRNEFCAPLKNAVSQ